MTEWLCGCGWINGCNLCVCAQCSRSPIEGNATIKSDLQRPRDLHSEAMSLCDKVWVPQLLMPGENPIDLLWQAYELEHIAIARCRGMEPTHSVLMESASAILGMARKLEAEEAAKQ